MGAVVQILGAANHTLTVFTDEAGHYTATGLLPGMYSLKVTAPSFLPALREKIGLRPGATLNVNVTLSTLLGVLQLVIKELFRAGDCLFTRFDVVLNDHRAKIVRYRSSLIR